MAPSRSEAYSISSEPNQIQSTSSAAVSEDAPKGKGVWCRTSEELVQYWENRLLSGMKTPWVTRRVDVSSVALNHPDVRTGAPLFVHTLEVDPAGKVLGRTRGEKPVLVMMPGFACGQAVFFQMFDQLSTAYRVFAIDMLGFGLSARPPFPDSPDGTAAESLFIDALEAWRISLGIDRLVVFGHSFGGYIATCYALRYPQSVSGLILNDPWGFPSPEPEKAKSRPMWVRVLGRVMLKMNLVSFLQNTGPIGYNMFRVQRRKRVCTGLDPERANTILEYLYHHNVCLSAATGAEGFRSILAPFAFAQRPLLDRIHDLAAHIPVLFVYGDKSWIGSASGEKTKKIRDSNRGGLTKVMVIEDAGHNVFADQPAALAAAMMGFVGMLNESRARNPVAPRVAPFPGCMGQAMTPPIAPSLAFSSYTAIAPVNASISRPRARAGMDPNGFDGLGPR